MSTIACSIRRCSSSLPVDLLPEKVTQLCLRAAGLHEVDHTYRQTNRLDKPGAADHHVAPRD
jgi:hypothetical protein